MKRLHFIITYRHGDRNCTFGTDIYIDDYHVIHTTPVAQDIYRRIVEECTLHHRASHAYAEKENIHLISLHQIIIH